MFARASGNLPLWAVVLNPLMNLSSHLTSLKELPNRRQLNEDGASWPYPILEMCSSMFIALSPWATSPHLQWWWIGWSIQRHSRWWIGPSWFLDGNVFSMSVIVSIESFTAPGANMTKLSHLPSIIQITLGASLQPWKWTIPNPSITSL